ncbi:MAG: lasso peptide biosynthesis B2 protein [Gammaproteobacteria bacterium]|nr:lasso peptide biosynthesis B2 protein [Gammaproteobacteria bacterium]
MAENAKTGRLSSLSAWQWRVLLMTPFVLGLTWWRLRRSGYQKTLARICMDGSSQLSPDDQLTLSRETAYAVAGAVKYGPWQPKCLLRSLALAWFLGRKRLPFEVKIGVPGTAVPRDPGWEAHAWVEHAGVVLNDRADVAGEYRVF